MESPTQSTSAARWGLVLVLLCGVFLAKPVGAEKDKPLKESEIIDLLGGEVPSHRIATLVEEKGIDFPLTSEVERRLWRAGATQELIDALAKASPHKSDESQPRAATLNVETKPGEAQVYLNDEPKGMSSPAGKLHLPGLAPGSYQLRVSLMGYQSWENRITVNAGETQTVFAALTAGPPAEKPPERPVASPPSPPGGELGNIPSLRAKVESLRFYAGDPGDTSKQERRYGSRFEKSSTTAIHWELHLQHPKPASRLDFVIEASWYGPDGSVVSRFTSRSYLLPEWANSNHGAWRGWKDAGHWGAGSYRVVLYIEGKEITSNTFEIY